MEFIKGYMDRGEYRELLCEMTQLIFGFTFEDWYRDGHFKGEYIPYSFLDNGKIVANASANIMKMMQNGREKLYIQIGTVMTRPEFRNQGLARSLIYKILEDYKDRVDGFYLYGNLSAEGFYSRIGFERLDQYRYSSRKAVSQSACMKFVKSEKEDLPKYGQALRNAYVNQRLDQINRYSLQLFYTADMEAVYYNPELNCFAVIEQDDKCIHLKSIISSEYIPVLEVLKRIEMPYEEVVLGFTPENEDVAFFEVNPYDGEDDYRFFYKGDALQEIVTEKLYFPLMSHA